jgi:hypothetical protein
VRCPNSQYDEDIESMNGRRAQRRENRRLRSSADSTIFHQKELELKTKMAVPLACSPSDKCAARHPTCFFPLKLDPHKDSSSYSASWFFKRRRRRRGVTTQVHKNSSSYKRERRKRDSHTTRVYNLSELVEPWLMNEFLHRVSGLFIAPNGKRDNYKRELKKGNEWHPRQSK